MAVSVFSKADVLNKIRIIEKDLQFDAAALLAKEWPVFLFIMADCVQKPHPMDQIITDSHLRQGIIVAGAVALKEIR